MPAVIAHRGASAEAPENTIRAFERAIGIGVDRIELNLRRTGDGGIAVIHDEKLSRLCGDSRDLGELSLAEANSLAVLPELYGTGPNTRIPGLEEVLDRIAPRCPLYLELKTDGDDDPESFTDAVLDLIPNGTVHRLASFDARVVNRALVNQHPAVLIADQLAALQDIEPSHRSRLHALSLRHTAINEQAVNSTRELGIELWAWTVDVAQSWRTLEELNATDGWCTNDPRALRAWLNGRES